MTKLESLLLFLDGHKAIFAQLLSAINTYLMAMGIVDKLLGVLIQTIIVIITGGAIIKTNNAALDQNSDNTFGAAVRKKRGIID